MKSNKLINICLIILLLGTITPQVYAVKARWKIAGSFYGFLKPISSDAGEIIPLKGKIVASLYDCDTCGGYFGSAKGVMKVYSTPSFKIRFKDTDIHFEKDDESITGFTLYVNGQSVRADGMYQGPDGKYYAETDQLFKINGNTYELYLKWESPRIPIFTFK